MPGGIAALNVLVTPVNLHKKLVEWGGGHNLQFLKPAARKRMVIHS